MRLRSGELDTNVVLDVLADRAPFADDAAFVLSVIERGEAEGASTLSRSTRPLLQALAMSWK